MQEMRKTLIRSLHPEDLLEWEMATHSSMLAWKIPWTQEPWWAKANGFAESDSTEYMYMHYHAYA